MESQQEELVEWRAPSGRSGGKRGVCLRSKVHLEGSGGMSCVAL